MTTTCCQKSSAGTKRLGISLQPSGGDVSSGHPGRRQERSWRRAHTTPPHALNTTQKPRYILTGTVLRIRIGVVMRNRGNSITLIEWHAPYPAKSLSDYLNPNERVALRTIVGISDYTSSLMTTEIIE